MYLPSTGDANAHPRLSTCNASGIAIRAPHPYIFTSAHAPAHIYMRIIAHEAVHIHAYAGETRADICRQALHVFNRGLAADLPVDRPAIHEPQPLAGCTISANPSPANPRVSAKAALAA